MLLVGYESGNQQILHNIKKGMRIDVARRFTEDCHKLGIVIHGTFIVGLPGETRETIAESIRFATEIHPHTIQVSLAAPYPGTLLHRQAVKNGWLVDAGRSLVAEDGFQISSLSYPHLSQQDIFQAVAEFYKRFYFRPRKIADITLEMLKSWKMTKRRLREGVEFMTADRLVCYLRRLPEGTSEIYLHPGAALSAWSFDAPAGDDPELNALLDLDVATTIRRLGIRRFTFAELGSAEPAKLA